jgi:benzoyl-CoA reductase subunit D
VPPRIENISSSMITAGVDMGSKAIKAVVLRDGKLVGRAIRPAGFDAPAAATAVLAAALREAGLTRMDVQRVIATGTGREEAPDRDGLLTEVSCAARAAHHLFPETRTVIEIGAEEGRAVRCNERGAVLDFAVNDKCAAGAGAFTEALARALEVRLEELGALSRQSTRKVPMNTQCAVFAESEVVSMIHGNVAKADIARAVHDAMASRIVAMVRRVGPEPAVTLLGGLALNVGFVDSLRRGLGVEALGIPDRPELCGAYGAALGAAGEAP